MKPLEKALAVLDVYAFDTHKVLCELAEKFPVEFLKLTNKYPAPAKNPAVSIAFSNEVCTHLLAGRKVNAIKLVRDEYGIGLKEAKGICDKMHAEVFGFKNYDQLLEVKQLLWDDKRASAIILLRQQTGFSVDKTKHIVDTFHKSFAREWH